MLFNEKQYQPQRLREYQEKAVAAIQHAWDSGDPAPLAALATGAGKTTILAQLLVETVTPMIHRALVVGHTEEIVTQLHERVINQFGGELNHYFGDDFAPGIGIVMAEQDAADARIVVATRQSLHKKRLAKLLEHGAFDILIIDEAHHALADNSYGSIKETLTEANPLLRTAGFTATPKRTDKEALGSLFTSICYQWLIPEGVGSGYLVPATRLKVSTKVDVSDLRTQKGDYEQSKLISALDTANWRDLCVNAYQQYIAPSNRMALAFLPNVAMSQNFAAALREIGVAAAHIDGETPKEERRRILAQYAAGEIRIISNCMVFTEGFDSPQTSAILLARPTRQSTLFTQIIGRGLRPYPGKHDCLIVDMTVVDTKALEVGTLLGRLISCPECKVEFYAALKCCPQCGAERKISLREAYERDLFVGDENGGSKPGQGLFADYQPMFEKAFAAWYRGADGFFSCTLSFEDGALVIVPPLQDNLYRLVHVPKIKDAPSQVLARNDDLTALMLDADEQVQQRSEASITQKDAFWRGDPPSPAQINLLSKLGVVIPDGLSKGAASQLITHTLAVRRLVME